MASSSSLLFSPHNWRHHVFPSFHGADVRKGFLSHLLKELRSKAIDTFIDNNIDKSKSIGPELIEAINGSRIAIVVLSKNYASSTWCLNELVEIIKCREQLGQIVMVLFYEVDPTDVKKQTGEFGKVFAETCRGKTDFDIGRWKQALAKVATIAGYHSRNWENEAQMIETISMDVSNKLNMSTQSMDFDSLVGMESHMTKMRPLLQLDLEEEARIIGILGPPGIGKTTIARFLYNQHSTDFHLSVFMENIRASYPIPVCSDDYLVKKYLQEQFMSQVLNVAGFKVPHLGIAKDRLKDKKVLAVLDDVNRLVQLEAMAKETCWFGPGSRIFITTQDERLLKASGVNHIYKVDLPSSNEAVQMFCMYAFGHKYPKDGFEGLAWEVTTLAGALPLGLKVMGSYFRGMSKQDWTNALPRLRTCLDGEIESVLKFSYDALCDEDKNIFLHIACFFENEYFPIVEGCLAQSFRSVTHGLHVLAEKSLILVNLSNVVKMHSLLVQLGREIVRKQSDEPWKRQFLDDATKIAEVLNDDKGGNSRVLGLDLNHFQDEVEKALERLSNLQFLRIRYMDNNPLKMISRKLRFLSWPYFQMPCLPSGFLPKFLVILDMRYSALEKLWDGIQPLNNLKWMDLSKSKRLKELPDLSTATNLYELNLNDCKSLMELPLSIGDAFNLETLTMYGCSSLVKLPFSIGNAVNLKHLDLRYCSSLVELPSSLGYAFRLNMLLLCFCSSLVELPSSMKNRSRLSYYELQKLGPWIVRSSLSLDASNCESLERLDISFRNPYIYLNFANCFKLNQEARDLIIQTRSNEVAVLPGGEVPAYFTYRASGNSLTVKLDHEPLRTSAKFKVCIIFANANYRKGYMFGSFGEAGVYSSITSKQNVLTVRRKKLHKVIPNHLNIFEVEAEVGTSTELLFEFELTDLTKVWSHQKEWEIKECGITQLLKVHSSGGHYKRFRDGDDDSEIERRIVKPKLDR